MKGYPVQKKMDGRERSGDGLSLSRFFVTSSRNSSPWKFGLSGRQGEEEGEEWRGGGGGRRRRRVRMMKNSRGWGGD